jgi:hypothetical protein
VRSRVLLFVAGLVGGPPVFGTCLSLALYEYGLALVPGPPEPTLPLATPAEAAEAWREVERSDRIEVLRSAPLRDSAAPAGPCPPRTRWRAGSR